MGGCCCCFFSSRRSELPRSPNYFYYPRASEEREPLSANHGVPSGLAGGLLVDTNLDTSIIDTYTAPPAPIPYDVDLGRPQTPNNDVSNPGSDEARNDIEPLETLKKDVKEINDKTQTELELTSSEYFEDDLKKPVESNYTIVEEEDCPICLEEYTEENPKMLTKCEHNFHLCCILEWMERSDTCPVCDKELLMDEVLDA